MKKKSIKTKLSQAVFLVSLVCMIMLTAGGYIIARNIVVEQTVLKDSRLTAYYSSVISQWFERYKSIIAIAGDDMRKMSNRDSINTIIDAKSNQFKLLNTYIGYSDDTYRFATGDAPVADTWRPTQRPWYHEAMKAGGSITITEPYKDSGTDMTIISFVQYLGKINNLDAVFSIDVDINEVLSVVSSIKIDDKYGYAFLLDDKGNIVSHPSKDYQPSGDTLVNVSNIEYYSDLMSLPDDGSKIIKDYNGVKSYLFMSKIGTSNWSLVLSAPVSSVISPVYIIPFYLGILLIILCVIFAAFIEVIVERIIIKPINELVGVTKRLAVGDDDIALQANSSDEIGELTHSLAEVVAANKEQSDVLEKISAGDFSAQISLRCEHDNMNKSLKKMADTQKAYVQSISNAMNRIASGDFKTKISTKYEGDFVPIKVAIDETQSKLNTYISDTIRVLNHMSNGILTEKITMNYVGDFSLLKDSINAMLEDQLSYVSNISKTMLRIQNGDLSASIDIEFLGDFASIKTSINKTVEYLRMYISELKNCLSHIADGDLTTAIKTEFLGDFSALKESTQHITRSLSNTLNQINNVADEVASGTDQMHSAITNVAQGASKQSESIASLKQNTDQMTQQIGKNFENTKGALTLNNNAMLEVDKGNQKMRDMITAMGKISETSNQISNIIKTINDIAFQTNLLALNAAVEAARAGEAGKGFSVVAEEVRNLANRSAVAAKDVESLIETSLTAVNNGDKIARETAETLLHMVDDAKKTNTSILNINEITQKQVSEISDINTELDSIQLIVHSNTAAAEQSAAASEELSAQAQNLKQLVNNFKTI